MLRKCRKIRILTGYKANMEKLLVSLESNMVVDVEARIMHLLTQSHEVNT